MKWNPKLRWKGDVLVVPVSADTRKCLVEIHVLDIARVATAKAWANRTGRSRFMRGSITARNVK